MAVVGTVNAQAVRSHTYHGPPAAHTRPMYPSYRPAYPAYRPHYYGGFYGGYRGYYGGIRVGVGGGWGYYGSPFVTPYYPVYGYSYYNPYYVARPPLVVDSTYTPQYYVRENTTGVVIPEKVEKIKLKPGETVRSGDVIIANEDGKLVIYQAEETNGEKEKQAKGQ